MRELGEVAAAIAGRVRASRLERGWTLDELASRSSMSRRMLVSIEQGRTNPSIATLLRLSDTLGIGLPALVAVDHTPALTVTRAEDAPVLWRGPLGGEAKLMAGTKPPNVVELWEWTLQPGESYGSDAHAAGTSELLLVIEGQVEVKVAEEVALLPAGDSAVFRGDRDHHYRNPATTAKARFTLAIQQPGVGLD
ncbi:helix-turn-helix domain-containing protein [Nonomuraea sp. KM88]|uniref:helix-turn-helix domain-containing protein n=1 Tax=Nonomuraea sp. KM88 TaxID=3457427 RepID=UPI003FCEA565